MTSLVVPEDKMAGSQIKELWLRCDASPGQFPGELAITGEAAGGGVFSLFMPEALVTLEKPPSEGNSVEAWLRVALVGRQDGLLMIRLPRQTLENGQFVTVRENQLEQEPGQKET